MKPIPPSSCDLQSLSFEAVNTNVNEQRLDDNLSELQDDEISVDGSKISPIFYRDSVDALTDKNFVDTTNSLKLTVVLFYAEFDSTSMLFQPLFAKINDDLGGFSFCR